MLASANPGCTLQIAAALGGGGKAIRTAHPIELLDAAISDKPVGNRANDKSA